VTLASGSGSESIPVSVPFAGVGLSALGLLLDPA